MDLKRDWKMQDSKKKNLLLMSVDLQAPRQDTAQPLFQHYLTTTIVVGQLRRLTAFRRRDDCAACPSSSSGLCPELVRGGTKAVCSGYSLLPRLMESAVGVIAVPGCAFVLFHCAFALGMEQPELTKVVSCTQGLILRAPESIFSELCHWQAAWPW